MKRIEAIFCFEKNESCSKLYQVPTNHAPQARIQDFGQGGQQSFNPKGDPEPNLLKIRVFPLKFPKNCMIKKKIGGKGGPQAPLDPLLLLVGDTKKRMPTQITESNWKCGCSSSSTGTLAAPPLSCFAFPLPYGQNTFVHRNDTFFRSLKAQFLQDVCKLFWVVCPQEILKSNSSSTQDVFHGKY